MFMQLLNTVLSSISPKLAQPDYEIFAKKRAIEATEEKSDADANSYTFSGTKSATDEINISSEFYDYLLGKCPHGATGAHPRNLGSDERMLDRAETGARPQTEIRRP